MKQPDRSLVAALDPFMIAHRFKFIKSRAVYIRKYEGGFDDFVFSTYPLATGEKWQSGYHEGFYGLGLRNDTIETITRVVMPIYGADNQRYASTVFRTVGNPSGQWLAFDPSRDRALCLRFDHLENDVAETVRRIEAMLQTDGWAWYERYADPVILSRDVNTPIDLLAGPHPLVNNSELRPLVGVAAACVGEPHRVKDLVDGYLVEAQKIDDLAAGRRAEAFTVKLAKQFDLIIDKARELGYLSITR